MIFWKEKWNNWKEDWSEHAPSLDQTRIVEYLKPISGKNILHIGTGNSSFAIELSHNSVDSITVLQTEIDKAIKVKQQYNLVNYNFWLCNKYTLQLLDLEHKYHYIADNNIFSFTSCEICRHNILFAYLKLLQPKGEIVTDVLGLDYRTGFTVDKLQEYIVDHDIPLTINKYNEYVIGLQA